MAMDGQYIRSPFLDERYQQNKISASPFSSAKRHLVRVEKVLPPISVATHKPIRSEEEFKQQHGIPPYFSCKMNYPYTLAGSPGLSKVFPLHEHCRRLCSVVHARTWLKRVVESNH